MTIPLDGTHDAALRSWVRAANDPASDFPIQNLPFGIFRRRGSTEPGGPCVAIGDRILSLPACAREGLVTGAALELTKLRLGNSLNALMAEGPAASRAVRQWLVELLQEGNAAAERRGSRITIPLSEVELRLPVRVGDYSDFYASIHHATSIGSMFRPDSPLLPNYKYVPIGYHGRASSIVVSQTAVQRPHGQTRETENAPPVFGPTKRLDYEVEIGAFIGSGTKLGQRLPLAAAEDHLWGVCLLNDWSARDIQSWEYQPLGPFLSKSFLTSVSPWIVTLDALAPFRVPAAARPAGDPAPLPYLADADNQRAGGLDLVLEAWLQSARMREKGTGAMLVSRSRFRDMYWTLAQLITHHASNGCNLRPGDLLGSGTVSGADKQSRGCLLERTWRGSEPLELPTGERRAFLEDGDEVVLRGYAERDGFRRIGLGECSGVVSFHPGSTASAPP